MNASAKSAAKAVISAAPAYVAGYTPEERAAWNHLVIKMATPFAPTARKAAFGALVAATLGLTPRPIIDRLLALAPGYQKIFFGLLAAHAVMQLKKDPAAQRDIARIESLYPLIWKKAANGEGHNPDDHIPMLIMSHPHRKLRKDNGPAHASNVPPEVMEMMRMFGGMPAQMIDGPDEDGFVGFTMIAPDGAMASPMDQPLDMKVLPAPAQKAKKTKKTSKKKQGSTLDIFSRVADLSKTLPMEERPTEMPFDYVAFAAGLQVLGAQVPAKVLARIEKDPALAAMVKDGTVGMMVGELNAYIHRLHHFIRALAPRRMEPMGSGFRMLKFF